MNAKEFEKNLEEKINSLPYYGHCTCEHEEGFKDGAEWAMEYAKHKIEEAVKKIEKLTEGKYMDYMESNYDSGYVHAVFDVAEILKKL